LLSGQVQLADLEVDVQDVVLAEVAAAIVELHDLVCARCTRHVAAESRTPARLGAAA
jgi:hypothetical protein